jgi:hypothetical protein
MAPHQDHTPLPYELASGYHENRLEIPTSCVAMSLLYQLASQGTRRGRIGGGPGGGCARRPVGTYLYLHAVGAGNPIAVLSLAR